MTWFLDETLELEYWGLLFCWLASLCFATPFWCGYLFLRVYRLAMLKLAGRKATPLQAMDAIIGQELDSPNCMINATLFLQGDVDAEANFRHFWQQVVAATVDELDDESNGQRKKRFPNFSRCLSYRYGYLAWNDVDPSDMDQARHLYQHPGAPLGSEEELRAVSNVYFNRVLPSNRPAWELVLVRLSAGWRPPSYPGEAVPQTAWLWRINHAIADGMSLMRILSEVLDTNRETNRNDPGRTVGSLPEWARPAPAGPERNRLWRRGLIHIVYFLMRSFFERDRGFLLARDVTHRKNFVWSNPIGMSRVRNLKKAAGAGYTVNDVVMSCVGGALRTFVGSEFAGRVPDRLRVYVPVSYRELSGPLSDGNLFLCPAVKLAINEADPRKRLLATKTATDEMKDSMKMGMNDLTTRLAGSSLDRRLMPLCLAPLTPSLTFSNMAGSPYGLQLVGCKIVDCFVFTPNTFKVGLSLAITTYCDSFVITVTMDTGINEHVQVASSLIKMVKDELDLLGQSLVLPSDGELQNSISRLSLAITSYCDSFVITVTMDTGINEHVQVANSLIKMVEDELDLLERSLVLSSDGELQKPDHVVLQMG